MDFSDIAMHNPARKPLPGQAHVITAMVKGLRRDRGGFNSGEMGVGKSLMAAVAAYKLLNGKGRVMLMVPDHTIDKWCDEIRTTIPNCNVISFDKWTEVIHYFWSVADFRHTMPKTSGANEESVARWANHTVAKRWMEPTGVDYVIIGRDQSKYLPNCPNMGEAKACFDGKVREFGGSTRRCVGHELVLDENGEKIWDEEACGWKKKPVVARIYRCPSCGAPIVDRKKGLPIDVAKSASGLRCTARIGVEVRDPDAKHQGKDKILLDGRYSDAPAGKLIKEGDRKYVIRVCGEPLWNYVRKPNRWAPATFVHSKMRGLFDLCIVDEVHEEKSDSSAQALAAGKLMAAARKILALTGTLIGGYAWHMFPTLMRIRPKLLVQEGCKWGGMLEFSKRYGRVDRVVKISQDDGETGSSRSRRSSSMRRVRNGKMTERYQVAPGVMPNLWARHLAECSVFLNMSDLADHMPPLVEYIGCDPRNEEFVRDPKDKFWINTAVEMEPAQSEETTTGTEICKATCDALLKNGSMRFLAGTLVFSMEYPDYPFDWTPDFEDKHSVGYWAKPGLKTEENWVGVFTPKTLDRDIVYPKEQRLIDICKAEKEAGNQVWVYVNMTGKRDVQPRLVSLLAQAGLKAGILRSKSVKPRDRSAWIEKQGRDYDVMLSHPRPVMTGLDLLSKKAGGHNYNSIVFYQTGTQAFVCKQASRRAWRLIQKRKCRVYYLYYRHTMQHHFVGHMAKKFAAMSAIAGDFSMDGLIAMGGSDDGALALCKSIGSNIDDNLLRANWAKAHGSYGTAEEFEPGGENLCPILSPGGDNRCPITDEDLKEWAEEAKQIEFAETESGLLLPAPAVGEEQEEPTDEDLWEEIQAENEWLSLSDEELEALNI